MDCAKQLIRTGGIGSLYRGLGATFVRAIPQAGLYFMTYEILKKAFTPADGSGLSTIRTLTAGGLTGIINWVFMLPADVVKSRIQTGNCYESYKKANRKRSIVDDPINAKFLICFRLRGITLSFFNIKSQKKSRKIPNNPELFSHAFALSILITPVLRSKSHLQQ